MSARDGAGLGLPAIIDVEASGFGRGSYPVEVGFVLPDGTPHCFLIKPMPGWTHWSKRAEALHGVTRECLEQRGRPTHEVAAALNNHLQGQMVYTDAWAFDLSWLGKMFDAVDALPAFRLASINELLTQAQQAAWDKAKREVVRVLNLQRHRASGDARILRETLRQVLGDGPW